LITTKKLADLQPVGIAISGEAEAVRALTKKFSLLKSVLELIALFTWNPV